MGAFERITVEVPSDMAETMRRSVEDGAYGSAEDIVDDALRDWARAQAAHKTQIERLREAVIRSDNSGPGIPADVVYARVRARIAERQARR